MSIFKKSLDTKQEKCLILVQEEGDTTFNERGKKAYELIKKYKVETRRSAAAIYEDFDIPVYIDGKDMPESATAKLTKILYAY